MLEKLRTLRQWPRQKSEPALDDNIVWLRPDTFRRNSFDFTSVVDERGFREWHRHVVQGLERDDASYVCELKLNGIEATLIYEDGLLVEAIPQADDPEWRSIARRMRALEDVPSTISRDDVPKRLEVLCEFYSNESRLQVFAHGIAHTEGGIVPGNLWAALSYLKNLGFKTSPHSRLARAPEEVIAFYRMWQAKRGEADYDCSGIVVKVNRKDYQRELGYTGGHARWAVIYKFPGAAPDIEREPFYSGVGGQGSGVRDLRQVAGAVSQKTMPLSGLRFLVTGESREFSRPQIEDMLRELGGAISEGHIDTADFLIAGDDASEFLLAQTRRSGVRAVPLHEFVRYYQALRLSSRLGRLMDRLDRL